MQSARPRPKVLIVEDDLDLAVLLTEALSDLDLDIQHVSAVGSALEFMEKIEPSLILLDLGLPDGDGSIIVDQMRLKGRHSTPLVVYTIRDLDQLEKARLKLGETHFFTKSRASLFDVANTVSEMFPNGQIHGDSDG